MKVDPARAKALISQLQTVTARIATVAKERPVSLAIIVEIRTTRAMLPSTCFLQYPCSDHANRVHADEGTTGCCLQAEASKRHTCVVPGRRWADSLRRELRPRAVSEGRVAALVDSMALHRWPPVRYVVVTTSSVRTATPLRPAALTRSIRTLQESRPGPQSLVRLQRRHAQEGAPAEQIPRRPDRV